MIDLHCHSTFSDGTLDPRQLLEKAQVAAIQMIALTDHDTVEGVALLSAISDVFSGRIIPGIEISTRFGKHDIHILGLNIQQDAPSLLALIESQREKRKERSLQINASLQLLGIDDALNKAILIAGHDRVSRPHFARVLINEGRVKDMRSAFKQFLGRGKKAYIPTEWVTVPEAVSTIVAAGGVPVIAHPLKYTLTQTKLVSLIDLFKEAGGIGMEVVSGETSLPEAEAMASLCRRFNLLASTGSDYHGEGISRVSLGKQRKLPLGCEPIWMHWM